MNEDESMSALADGNISMDRNGLDPTSNDSTNQKKEQKQQYSAVLRSIVKDTMSIQQFFEKYWQQQAVVFSLSKGLRNPNYASSTVGGNGDYNDKRMKEEPFEELLYQGWHVLTQLLEEANIIQEEEEKGSTNVTSRNGDDGGRGRPHLINPTTYQPPLVFQNRVVQDPHKIRSVYGTSLFTPYLDGCSIVLNHADLLSPWIAAICEDLQNSFPHAYANCYLTPPGAQAAPPHADDRDVLVLQVVGSKVWHVYQTVPIPYPYPHEQVGKEGLEVPKNVLDGPLQVDTTLKPGDVLYMPRGMVHEAHCQQELSFHITIALATHDWTLAGIISSATEQLLTQVLNYRRSIFPTLPSMPDTSATSSNTVTTTGAATSGDVKPTNNNKNGNKRNDEIIDGKRIDIEALSVQVNAAMDMLRDKITPQSIARNLDVKLEQHNERALPIRMNRIRQAKRQRFVSSPSSSSQPLSATGITAPSSKTVGLDASRKITFFTVLRAATPEERASVASLSSKSQPRGLHVREDIADEITQIISKFKTDPTLRCRVMDMRSLITTSSSSSATTTTTAPSNDVSMNTDNHNYSVICDLTLLCLARRCVELGALAVIL